MDSMTIPPHLREANQRKFIWKTIFSNPYYDLKNQNLLNLSGIAQESAKDTIMYALILSIICTVLIMYLYLKLLHPTSPEPPWSFILTILTGFLVCRFIFTKYFLRYFERHNQASP